MVFTIAIAILMLSMVLVMIRGVMGPTVHDRILATNAFGSNTVIMIILLAFASDDLTYIDVALVYALVNFVTTIGILKYFKYGRFDVDSAMEEDAAQRAKLAAQEHGESR